MNPRCLNRERRKRSVGYTVPMCGRYTIYENQEALEARFGATFVNGDAYRGHYNAAPSQQLPIILNEHPKDIVLASWGFVPSWAYEGTRIPPAINARGETIAPLFRDAFAHRRCLVLVNGFYEWDRNGRRGNAVLHHASQAAHRLPVRVYGSRPAREHEACLGSPSSPSAQTRSSRPSTIVCRSCWMSTMSTHGSRDATSDSCRCTDRSLQRVTDDTCTRCRPR